MNKCLSGLRLVGLLLLLGMTAPAAWAGQESPGGAAAKNPPQPVSAPPAGSLFRLDRCVYDTTGGLNFQDSDRIQDLCEHFYEDTRYPLAVVILDRLSEIGVSEGDTRAAGQRLLIQWVRGRMNPEHGILLLVVRGERRIRIQVGPAWGNRDALCAEIIRAVIAPKLAGLDRKSAGAGSALGAAILGGVGEVASLFYREKQNEQPVFEAVDLFVARSWLWILLGLHLLGFLYVLSTKETQSWYLAGAVAGLPILAGLLFQAFQREFVPGSANQDWKVLSLEGPGVTGAESSATGVW